MARRAKRVRDARQIGAFLRRQTRAMVKRAEAGELDVLAELRDTRSELDRCMVLAARALNAQGLSWGDVARELGMTRQSAWQRFSEESKA